MTDEITRIELVSWLFCVVILLIFCVGFLLGYSFGNSSVDCGNSSVDCNHCFEGGIDYGIDYMKGTIDRYRGHPRNLEYNTTKAYNRGYDLVGPYKQSYGSVSVI